MSQNFGQGTGAWSSLENFPVIYSLITMQNSVAVSHIVCARVGGPKKFGTLGPVGTDSWQPIQTHPHRTLPCHIGRSTSNGTKMGPSRSAFQGHSRSSEHVSIGYDFLLTFHSNHKPVSYRFRHKWRFSSRFANLSKPRVFKATA